jgi:hypothetical protein
MAVVYTSPDTGTTPVNTLNGNDTPLYGSVDAGDVTIEPLGAVIPIEDFE